MRISVERACEIINKEILDIDEYKISEIVDIGNAYAFCMERLDGSIVPGDCPITVDKVSGNIDYLTIPPIENLDKLESGKSVAIPKKWAR